MQATVDLSDGVDDPTTLIAASRRHRLATSDLCLGMFVAELDRPWLDTPFLLQGFLIDSQVELDTLRRYCSYVYVDVELSLPEVADAIRHAEIEQVVLGAPPQARTGAPGAGRTEPGAKSKHPPAADGDPHRDGRATMSSASTRAATASSRPMQAALVYRVRSDVQISADTRQRFRQMVRATSGLRRRAPREESGMLGRAFGWLKDMLGGQEEDQSATGGLMLRVSREATRRFLPPGLELNDYPEVRSVEEEMPPARSSLARSEDVLRQVGLDVKAGRTPDLELLKSSVDDLVDSLIDNPDALMWVARMRDEDLATYQHGVKVALYMVTLGRHLGLPKQELAALGTIGMLADVGKTKLPRAILEKPGMLSPSEFSMVKEHVRLGLEELQKHGTLSPDVVLGIAQHHERLDGTGYPIGLKGDDISLYGRVAAIADCFAALITPRAYANPSAPQDALMNLFEWAGTSFHEPLVEHFVQAVGVFPVGSLVELSTGEISVVVAHNRVRRLEPRVLMLTGADKAPLGQPVERDLLVRANDGGRHSWIVRGLPSGAYGLKLRDYYAGGIARAHGLPT